VEKLNGMISLFSKVRPIQEVYTSKILSQGTVKEHKITEKEYKQERLMLRNEHWDKLKRTYFDSKDGTLQIKDKYKNMNKFVNFEPLNEVTDQNS